VDASKESCRLAIEKFDNLEDDPGDESYYKFVRDFLEACLKRLPTQRAVDNNKYRRKTVRKK
jgi:hypothetical protein